VLYCAKLQFIFLQEMDELINWYNAVGSDVTKSNTVCNETRLARFKDHFGIYPRQCAFLWILLSQEENFDSHARKNHLLWALYWLKTNCTEKNAHGKFGMDEKTFRKWKYYFVLKIAELDRVSLFCACQFE